MAAATGAIILGAAFSTGTVALTTGAFIGGSLMAHFAVSVALGAAMQALAPKPSISGLTEGIRLIPLDQLKIIRSYTVR